MEKKGLTKKQFWIQMAMVIFWELYAAYWIIEGIVTKSPLKWIAGAVFSMLYLGFAIYLIYQRKRYPIEDAQLDKQVDTGMKGMGIVLGFITVAFLIAFGLAALLK
jgi:threonine/homoserine/homoserine lactone efflux protein